MEKLELIALDQVLKDIASLRKEVMELKQETEEIKKLIISGNS